MMARIGDSITRSTVGVVSLLELASKCSNSCTISGVDGRSVLTETSLLCLTEVLSTIVVTMRGVVLLSLSIIVLLEAGEEVLVVAGEEVLVVALLFWMMLVMVTITSKSSSSLNSNK